jgi:hypothetical protein
MVELKHRSAEAERRREAVLIGRRGIGRQLQRTYEEVLREPVPGYWLALLTAAEHREGLQVRDQESRRAG